MADPGSGQPHLLLPPGLLELGALLGASQESLRDVEQIAQKKGIKKLLPLEPEVLSIFVPPFISKEDSSTASANCTNLNKTRRRSFRKKRDKLRIENWKSPQEVQKVLDVEDVSIPNGVDLNALPQLCFPGGLCVTPEPKEDRVHFLVLTDICGNRTYGVVAQYYKPVQDEHCFYNGKTHWEFSGQIMHAVSYFVPFAICLISRYPYYNAFRDCLSCLLAQLKFCKDFDVVDERIKDFAAKLSLIPSPPPGPLHLVFNMKPLQVVFPSRADPDSPIIDLDLHLPLLCFKPEKVLQIITCILTEQRIVFFSSDWALLTLIAECFMLYLHPIQWQHTFVPILSGQMLDFVMAPTSFLMGCHLDHFEEVSKEADGLILINIDNGNITYSKSLDDDDDDDDIDIPDIPLQAAQTFIQRVESLQLHYDLELSHLMPSTDLSGVQARRRAWQQKQNSEMQQITLQLIVNIFREVKNHLNYEHRVFNSEEFLKTRAPQDQPFYKKVLETYIFHSFLKARLNRRMDAFAQMELSTESEEDRMNVMLISPRRPTIEKIASRKFSSQHIANRRMVMSMPNLQDIKIPELPPRNSSLRKLETVNSYKGSNTVPKLTSKSVYTFKIPEIHFPLVSQCVHSYYEDFINFLSKDINCPTSDNSVLLARYLYLRGLINLMQGKLLRALSDFQSLYKTDISIFPADLVNRMVASMSSSERSQADRQPELKRLISEITEKPREATKIDDHVKNFELPKKHMHLDDFVKRIQESGIVKDIKIIHQLFEALTVGHQKQIDPETFRDFYNYWKETETEAQEVNLPPEVIEHLDKNECVYKLSSSVKTNLGVGKIAMTQKRLFLLTEGRPGYVEISTFRNIEEVKSTTVAFLVLRIPTLKIKTISKKEVFEANLKTECDLWHLMVKEMWAGKKMADDYKDPQYIQQALTNVLLMDAVVGALQSSNAIYAASKLSYFDKMKTEMPVSVPKTTSETLKHKINPSLGETSPQAIDILLYTPGHLDPAEKIEDAHPKLWCALSEGKMIVFDASSWTIHQQSFKVGTAKLNCMLMAEQNQVWIGSQDSIIYIINIHSMSCNKQLTDHRSSVMDLIIEDGNEESGSEVYSCSLDGVVIVWNVSTLKVNRRFCLPCQNLTSIKFHNGHLWCCTGYSIMVVTNGFLRQELKIDELFKETYVSFLCFQLVPEKDQVWAACAGCRDIYVWNIKDFSRPPHKIQLQDCSEISCMIKVKNQIWVGSKGLSQGKCKGKIYVIDAEKKTVEKELVAHADMVKALCSAEDRYVLSGSGKEEGKIAIWKVE
ncbi:DENN domain-containing protein 3 isoform X2 [Sarcophilus harrisii]|uniref:DENN domain-containing protein 3 isoform X2 n=1 Tax=Sarcophilus harrisii TaxID=9305 RepID=UPI00130200BE|nr:DENN domain-containing protein 3 isoform X2 [Sarcophilus harrisii]